MYSKGQAFSNYDSNISKRSSNYSTYFIDVDETNDDDVQLLNLVRGATLLTHGYAVSQASRCENIANEIGREQLSILAYQYCMPDSDYHKGNIPNTLPTVSNAKYVQTNSRSFLDMLKFEKYSNSWIETKDIESYTEKNAEFTENDDEYLKRFPFLYGIKGES